MNLTRRSLLRTAALAPLILPGRGLARTGGAAAVVAGPGPCGSAIPITSDAQITAPGCYSLTANVAGDFTVGFNSSTLAKIDNVTVLGNGHTVSGILTVGRGLVDFAGGIGFDSVGVVVQDIIVGSAASPAGSSVAVNGNNAQALTPLAVYLKGITIYSDATYGIAVTGSNVLIENSTFHTVGSPPTNGTDDTAVIWNSNLGTWCYYVTLDNCVFTSISGAAPANFDTGVEGLSTWHFVTIKNCTSVLSPFGGFGGWYQHGGDGNCGMTINNCQFFNNTLHNGWRFCNPQNPSDTPIGSGVAQVTDDAMANSLWGGSLGNVFGLPAGPPNTYV